MVIFFFLNYFIYLFIFVLFPPSPPYLVGNRKSRLGGSSSLAAVVYLGNCFLVHLFGLLIGKTNTESISFCVETNVSKFSRNKQLVSFVSIQSGVERYYIIISRSETEFVNAWTCFTARKVS